MKLAEFIRELYLEAGNISLVGAFFLTTGDLGEEDLALTFVETQLLTIGDGGEDDLDLQPVLVKCFQLFEFPLEPTQKQVMNKPVYKYINSKPIK